MKQAADMPRPPMAQTINFLAEFAALTARMQQAFTAQQFANIMHLVELATRVDRAALLDYLGARGDVGLPAIKAAADLCDRDWLTYFEQRSIIES